MINDKIQFKGDVFIVRKDINGIVKETREVNNLVVTAGKQWIVQRMASNGSGLITHIGVGTGATTAAAGDTALVSQLVRQAIAGTATATGVTITHNADFIGGVATGAWTEAGLFTASTGGVMLARVVFPVMNKASGDIISISWTITAV